MKTLTIRLDGQVRGGKNNMIVLRNGMHIPKSSFSKWSKVAIAQAMSQRNGGPFTNRLSAIVEYTPGDARIRDMPAIMDSIWHVLERSEIVKNDTLIKDCHWLEKPLDRENPGCVVQLTEIA